MDDLASERAGIVGHARLVVVSAGDYDTAIDARAVLTGHGHVPALVSARANARYAPAELDVVGEVVGVHVAAEVGQDLGMTGVGRVSIVAHRQVIVRGGVAGRHQVRGLVDDAAVGVDVPK